MSLLYVMSVLAAGLFAERRSFISVINLSIQNIQSNAACRRTSTCLFIISIADRAQFFQRNVHLFKFYGFFLICFEERWSLIPIMFVIVSDFLHNCSFVIHCNRTNDYWSDSKSYFDSISVCVQVWFWSCVFICFLFPV